MVVVEGHPQKKKPNPLIAFVEGQRGRRALQWSPLSAGDVFQGPQWLTDTMHSTKLCMYCFFYIYILMLKFNL